MYFIIFLVLLTIFFIYILKNNDNEKENSDVLDYGCYSEEEDSNSDIHEELRETIEERTRILSEKGIEFLNDDYNEEEKSQKKKTVKKKSAPKKVATKKKTVKKKSVKDDEKEKKIANKRKSKKDNSDV